MEQDTRFYTALSLENHPIHNENEIYKERYISALYYFVQKYASEDIYAKGLLGTYMEVFNSNKVDIITNKRQKKDIEKLCGIKVKGFKLFTYRFVFICDCLFINAYDQPILAKRIIDKFKTLFSTRYHAKMDELYEVLYKYKSTTTDFKLATDQINNWIKNQLFIKQKLNTVIITATMSAGKSTLINAVMGKDIVKTKNGSCTAKCYKIYDKAYEDHRVGTIGDDILLDTNKRKLMALNDAREDEVKITSFMQYSLKDTSRNCIIDTPGVNSHMDATHAPMTRKFLKEENYDKVFYIINAENIGTEDDLEHMKYIFNNLPQNNIIFVLNKLDRFRLKDDSVSQSIDKIYLQLKKIGYYNPTIVPVSAFAGQLFKRVLCGQALNEDENDECMMLLRKFSRGEFNFSTYYNKPTSWEGQLDYGIEGYTPLQVAECLRQSGLPSLEKLMNREEVAK